MKDRPENEKPGLDDLISLSEASERSGLSISQLRLLVSRGEIWGRKLGRNWFTTDQSVNDYLAQPHKPGPKPKGQIK
jgi:hypothetical protein